MAYANFPLARALNYATGYLGNVANAVTTIVVKWDTPAEGAQRDAALREWSEAFTELQVECRRAHELLAARPDVEAVFKDAFRALVKKATNTHPAGWLFDLDDPNLTDADLALEDYFN